MGINKILTKLPLIDFFWRTWRLLAATILTNFLTLWNKAWVWVPASYGQYGEVETWRGLTLFDILGAVLYIPGLFCAALWVGLLGVNLFHRNSIVRDSQSGKSTKDWDACTSDTRMYCRTATYIGYILAASLIAASMAKGQVPDQVGRWNTAKVSPAKSIAVDLAASRYLRLAERYQKIEVMRKNGVPAPVLYCLHQRESSGSFLHHPHEGSPLTGRTRYVPKGRLPVPGPPYTFEQSAEDAYYSADRLDLINWNSLQEALWGIEKFNGQGYAKYHRNVPSPYLWAGTTVERPGKYVADGRFSATARDGQLGCCAILKRLIEKGVVVRFTRPPPKFRI